VAQPFDAHDLSRITQAARFLHWAAISLQSELKTNPHLMGHTEALACCDYLARTNESCMRGSAGHGYDIRCSIIAKIPPMPA
jgi:hypothetical protein